MAGWGGLRAVREETMEILEAGKYVVSGIEVTLSEQLKEAVKGTKTYLPAELESHYSALATSSTSEEQSEADATRGVLDILTSRKPKIEVTAEKSHVAAERLMRGEGKGNTVVLNFANGHVAGGGYVEDARAQEEDLCRVSGLYPCLLSPGAAPYFRLNNEEEHNFCTDALVYSPQVPFFRSDGSTSPSTEGGVASGVGSGSGSGSGSGVGAGGAGAGAGAGGYNLTPYLYLPSVISAPAPCLIFGPELPPALRHKTYEQVIEQRVAYILTLAALHGHRTLVLGAWGCGAFRNPAAVISRAFQKELFSPRFVHAFDHVVFPCFGPPANLQAFKLTFADFLSP